MVDLSTLLPRWTRRTVYSGCALRSLLRLWCVGRGCILGGLLLLLRQLGGGFGVVHGCVAIMLRLAVCHAQSSSFLEILRRQINASWVLELWYTRTPRCNRP